MVRATKSVEKKTTQVAKVSIPVEKTGEVKQKKERKPKAEPVVAVAAVGVETPVVPTDVDVVEPNALTVKMTEFSSKLQHHFSALSTLKTEFKAIEKSILREIKIAAKASSKKRKSNINRKPSGFVKPTRISDELAKFLEKEIGTELARTTVSKEINSYINAHKLQDSKNGRIIHPDAKLTQLLKVLPGDELTYFNLQRYMKHHFIKETPVV